MSGAQRMRSMDGLVARIWRGLLAVRGALFVAALAASLAAFVAFAWTYLAKRHDNAVVAGLVAGRDIAIDPARASSEVVLARAHFLLFRDELDEAQALIDQAAPRVDAPVRARLLYNMANARLRKAVAEIEKGALDAAIPLVALAKDEYRRALRIAPDSWDMKYNIDVAMRLVRDFPQLGESEEEDQEAPKRVWTDLPGVPKGLP